ncbi:hypothetical protein Tco_0591638 [Tanacetum coccineum]
MADDDGNDALSYGDNILLHYNVNHVFYSSCLIAMSFMPDLIGSLSLYLVIDDHVLADTLWDYGLSESHSRNGPVSSPWSQVYILHESRNVAKGVKFILRFPLRFFHDDNMIVKLRRLVLCQKCYDGCIRIKQEFLRSNLFTASKKATPIKFEPEIKRCSSFSSFLDNKKGSSDMFANRAHSNSFSNVLENKKGGFDMFANRGSGIFTNHGQSNAIVSKNDMHTKVTTIKQEPLNVEIASTEAIYPVMAKSVPINEEAPSYSSDEELPNYSDVEALVIVT